MPNSLMRLKPLLLAALFLFCGAHAAVAGYGVDWVVLVDNTGTMRYQSRGEMTVKAIKEFVSLTEPGDRISICSYGERSVSVLPNNAVVIEDESSKDYVRAHTKFGFNADRTDITAGLEYVWRMRAHFFPGLEAGDGKGADAVIVLLTDGKLVPVYRDYAQYEATYDKSRRRLLELASLCADEGIRICTIGLGRSNKVDGELLEDISTRTGGTYRHVAAASGVAEAYRAIASEQRPSAPAHVVEAPGDPSAGALGTQDAASEAPGQPREKSAGREHVGARSRGVPVEAFPADFCLASAGVLAIFIGMIAVGTERRQRWAARFSGSLFGGGEKLVRGYLKPIDAPGTISARPIIGLENEAAESVKVGTGTSYISHIDTTVEFVGTTDESPPQLRAESGIVTVEGEATTVRKLRDGDVIEIEGLRYQYLRGNRR